MTFRKNNEFCWQPEGENPLDPKPICFKLDSELKAELKAIPDWQKRLRAILPRLIEQWKAG